MLYAFCFQPLVPDEDIMTPDSFLTLEQACNALKQGRCIIYPTETFYGLGCDALNPDAVGKIFSIKKRDLSMPLPVIISSSADLEKLVAFIPDTAQKLMDKFWPGSLSIVLPALSNVPDLLTAGKGRIAVRQSPHPAPKLLGEISGLILVSSSANESKTEPARRLENLPSSILQEVAGIYDMPPLPKGGLPSTVVDVVPGSDGEIVRIRRAGVISAQELLDAGFEVEIPDSQ